MSHLLSSMVEAELEELAISRGRREQADKLTIELGAIDRHRTS